MMDLRTAERGEQDENSADDSRCSADAVHDDRERVRERLRQMDRVTVDCQRHDDRRRADEQHNGQDDRHDLVATQTAFAEVLMSSQNDGDQEQDVRDDEERLDGVVSRLTAVRITRVDVVTVEADRQRVQLEGQRNEHDGRLLQVNARHPAPVSRRCAGQMLLRSSVSVVCRRSSPSLQLTD